MTWEEEQERQYRVGEVIKNAREIVRHCMSSDATHPVYHDVHWTRIVGLKHALKFLDDFDKRIPE